MRVLVDAAGVTKPAGNSGWSLAVLDIQFAETPVTPASVSPARVFVT
jgi:hypothetical protein